MQFGKSLVGAIIGAALGIGLLIVVYLQFGIDKMWMAIPVALLTGLGVRMVVAKSGGASYVRGAFTVLIALAAYLGGLQITKAIASHRATIVPNVKIHADADEPAGEAPAAKSPESEPAGPAGGPPRSPAERKISQPSGAMNGPQPMNKVQTWDFLFLAIAALVAYELGRGTGGIAGSTAATVPGEPHPAGTHPDA